VFLHLLTHCNLRCRHCYINPAQHGERMLDLATIENWLAALAHRRPTANLILLGGEPTLHPELAPAVRAARRLGYASVTIDTNGYLGGDILEKVQPGEVDFFSFSLDGARAPTNDRIRGEGAYRTCVRGIRAAAARGFHTSLIYTVSRANLDELDQMVPLLRELPVTRFFIQVIGIRGRSADCDPRQLQVSRAEWLAVVPAVAARIAALGIPTVYPKVFLDPGEPFACAGRVAENFFIFPNGRVYRCPLCEDFPIHSLELRDNVLIPTPRINEADLFELQIPEGCVMNKIIQPANLRYRPDGTPEYQIACCLLKEEIGGSQQR
jgi:MoaA/NifB/PqqE/SkfB family radical SAM enzyme